MDKYSDRWSVFTQDELVIIYYALAYTIKPCRKVAKLRRVLADEIMNFGITQIDLQEAIMKGGAPCSSPSPRT